MFRATRKILARTTELQLRGPTAEFAHTHLSPGNSFSCESRDIAGQRSCASTEGALLIFGAIDRAGRGLNRDALTQTDLSRVFCKPASKPLDSPHAGTCRAANRAVVLVARCLSVRKASILPGECEGTSSRER